MRPREVVLLIVVIVTTGAYGIYSYVNHSNWMIYENEEYGFSLAYPEGWELDESNKTFNKWGIDLVAGAQLRFDAVNEYVGTDTVNFGITNLSKEEIVKIISNYEFSVPGLNPFEEFDFQPINESTIQGYRFSVATDIGIPDIFHYYPISLDKALVFIYREPHPSDRKKIESVIKTLLVEEEPELTLQYLYSSNAGLAGFFNNGRAVSCRKCDLFEENIQALYELTSYSDYFIQSDHLLLNDGSKTDASSLGIFPYYSNDALDKGWLIFNFKKIR
ncbi:hypothetical protein IPG41_01365 [Candidatus Peregrinibacteria bacterium]|nr:MAG: hypothetical protein IPG41_01365 [Candidatus Peregrinibacteria bacterium]